MSIRDYKITDEQFNEKGMTSLPDTLNGTPYENKRSLEKFTREVVAPQFNAIVEDFAQMEESTDNWSAEEARRVQNENARQTAEQGRAGAENTRVQNESARLSAESQRVENENARVAAEAARASAESVRDTAEKSRLSAESTRANAETSRVTAEEQRVNAESSRAESEAARTAAEITRRNEEAGRVSAEAERRENETARQTAETGRVSAETARADAEQERQTAEAARAGAEAARAEAETARQTAEKSRASAEDSRHAKDLARSVWEAYDASKTYIPGNKVSFNGSSYLCIQTTTGHAPTDTAYWLLIAMKGVDGTGAGDMLASVYDPQGKAQDVFAYTDGAVKYIREGLLPNFLTLSKADDYLLKSGGEMTGPIVGPEGSKAAIIKNNSGTVAIGNGETNIAIGPIRADGSVSPGCFYVSSDSLISIGSGSAAEVWLESLIDPQNDTDAANKRYVDNAVKYHSNPNLLDNWFFGRPVNQRGQTEYTATGYTVDRWKSLSSSITTQIVSGGITFSTSVTSGATEVCEYFENVIPAGTMLTVSAIISKTADSKSGIVHVKYVNNEAGIQASLPDRAMDYELITLSQAACLDVNGFVFRVSNGDGYTVHAAKLELGDQQTLAHKENGVWVLNEVPDYGEQLRRCMYYAEIIETSDTPAITNSTLIPSGATSAVFILPYARKRTVPVISFSDVSNYRIIARSLSGGTTAFSVTNISLLDVGRTKAAVLVSFAATNQDYYCFLQCSDNVSAGYAFVSADL